MKNKKAWAIIDKYTGKIESNLDDSFCILPSKKLAKLYCGMGLRIVPVTIIFTNDKPKNP